MRVTAQALIAPCKNFEHLIGFESALSCPGGNGLAPLDELSPDLLAGLFAHIGVGSKESSAQCNTHFML